MKRIQSFLKNLSSHTLLLLILLLISAFLLGGLTTKLLSLKENELTKAPKGVKADVSIGHFPVLGKKDAKVIVIEFADFQCPFCERFFKDAEKGLIKDYVKTGKVKFVFRNYAFLGKESTWAAEASECANEQEKFWEYHDYLYNHQGPENSGAFAKDKLEGFAEQLGLNTNQFNSCLETDKYAKAVADDLAEGQKAGVSGTPATFINGQLVVGAQPYSAFKTIIDQALTKK